MTIQILPETVAAQIAAGEVIERPASVVKELIENSLDARANHIEVEISGSGIGQIRVTDNGLGILSDEAELSLVRHATSKLQTIDDLNTIATLGFRGEALASIASVSRLTLETHHVDEANGTRIRVEGGELQEKQSIGIPTGTSIEVENLFFNVPARRKFLKSDTTERRHITNLITRYAMAYPAVRFALYNDNREAFRTSGNGSLADVLADIFGIETFREMVEITPVEQRRVDLPPIEVYGYTTTPNQTRSNRSQIMLFVNGRSIQDQRLTYAVVNAYHTLIPQGRYPITALMIELPPQEVDVNVHPTKAEVRFRSADAVFSVVQRAVRNAVIEFSDARHLHPIDYISTQQTYVEPTSKTPPRVVDSGQFNLDTPDRGRRGNQLEQTMDDEQFVKHIPSNATRIEKPRTLPPMRVVGQIAASYIVAEGPAGLYLIDQHAAHERIMYEEFMSRHAAQDHHRQHTLEATVVDLAPNDARLLDEYINVLAEIGFVIEGFGKNAYRVQAVPAVLADHAPQDILHRVLHDAEEGSAPGASTIEEKLVRRVCKTAAVKAGQLLSYDEMQAILRQLERCENPHTCPHGRPTMIHMSASDLAREFGRT